MDINDTLLDARFKDARPMDTVGKIRQILAEHDIATEEEWSETGVPYCHSLVVRMKGTTFQVNGKGLSREFTLASGYGELIERFQLGYIGALEDQKTGSDSAQYALPRQSAQDLLHAAPHRYRALSQRLEQIMGLSMSPEQILTQFADAQGQIPCVPCYDLTGDEMTWFPDRIRTRVYGSNGCAAGNTMEEAIVQGLSEVVERHTQAQINLRQITPPDVPEEVLRQCDTAYEIIQYVRSRGYRVMIKDCSLGTGFPVICACFIHEATGRYHTHFGAYPVFQIALTRALTESFQGRDIDHVADMGELSCGERELTPLECLTGDFFKGVYKKSATLFAGPPSFPYDPDMGFTATSNGELLCQCVDYFKKLGHQILVYDRSVLGFPTCQVLVPGYSEVFVDRLSKQEDRYRYGAHAARALRRPSQAQIPDMLGLLMHLEQVAHLSKDDDLSRGFLNAANLSAKITPAQQSQLMSATLGYIYYTLGRYDEVIHCIGGMTVGLSDQDLSYLTALKRYLGLRQGKKDPALIRQILEVFHDPDTLAQLYRHLDQGTNPLERFTLHCQLDCGEHCLLFGSCCKAYHNRLSALVARHAASYDPTSTIQHLRSLLK